MNDAPTHTLSYGLIRYSFFLPRHRIALPDLRCDADRERPSPDATRTSAQHLRATRSYSKDVQDDALRDDCSESGRNFMQEPADYRAG